MGIDQELAQASMGRDSVLTIGVFDGVHRGHAKIIGRLVREAADTGRLAGVVTFRNHPSSVLRPNFNPQYLTKLEERLHLIGKLGVDFVVPVTFDMELARLSAADFATRLQHTLGMRGLVVGPDFGMGYKREATGEALKALGANMDFNITIVDLLREGGLAVKSSAIRMMVSKGDVIASASMLGRPFALTGKIVNGVGRGRELGFPTANLSTYPGMAIPANGIYAAWARIGKEFYMAATSIGTRPTFDDAQHTIEAFLLEFDGDLYNQDLRLEFMQRLRDEKKYETVEDLKVQIERDVDATKAILSTAGT